MSTAHTLIGLGSLLALSVARRALTGRWSREAPVPKGWATKKIGPVTVSYGLGRPSRGPRLTLRRRDPPGPI